MGAFAGLLWHDVTMGDESAERWERLGPQYEVAFDLAVKNAEREEAALDELRQRTGVLMSAAAIGTSFLGAAAAQPTQIGLFAVIALTLFVIVEAICVVILLPRGKWGFLSSGALVISKYIETANTASMPELYRGLAMDMSKRSKGNRETLSRLYRAFGVAGILLLLEVLAWVEELVV